MTTTTTIDRQAQAVVREYRNALEKGAYGYAAKIRHANPDLASHFDEVFAQTTSNGGAQ